jgi:uncharacterized membrane protein YdbT with pleckstrin-like domain
MIEGTIRPSMKTVWAAYMFALLVVIAGFWLYYTYGQEQPRGFLAIPLIAFLPPLKMHLTRRLITMRLEDNHLIIENGFFSRTRRIVDTMKIQDVTVKQRLGQRILGTGDLTLEDAGQGGAMGMPNVDRPYQIADAIIKSAKRG